MKKLLFFMLLFTAFTVNAQRSDVIEIYPQKDGKIKSIDPKLSNHHNSNKSISGGKTAKKAHPAAATIRSSKAIGGLINETFDTFLPINWALSSESGYWMDATEAFEIASSEPFPKENGDTYYAAFDAYNGTESTPYSLITPDLIPTTENHILSYEVLQFLMGPSYVSSGAKMYVELGLNGGANWVTSTDNAFAQIPGYNVADQQNLVKSTTLTLDLTPFIGQTIKVRFRAVSDHGGFIYGLDDVKGVPMLIPDNPELAVSKVSSNVPNSFPFHQAPEILPQATVTNSGHDMVSTATLNFAVNPGDYTQDVTIPILVNNASQTLSPTAGNGFTPTVLGKFTIKASTDFVDSNPDDNFAETTFNVTADMFARDNGVYISGLGNGSGTITLANKFELIQPDVVSSFLIAFSRLESTEFKLRIYSLNNEETSVNLVYESGNFNRDAAAALYELTEFEIEPQSLPAGKYLFCINQFNIANIGCAYDGASNGFFYTVNSNGSLTPYENSTYGNIAIRVVTTQVMSIVPENGATDVEIDTPVSVTFTENMVADDLSDIAIAPDPGNVSASLTNNVLTITHDDFAYDTEYTVTIPVTAITGLSQEMSWSFTTRLDPSACNIPTDLNEVPDIYSATLSWTENGAGTTWDIRYSTEASFDPSNDDGTLITDIDTNPYTMTSISPNTLYYYAVRSNCGVGTYSEWSEVSSFQTQPDCDAPITTFPWIEGFESETFPETCWTRYNIDGGGSQWERNTAAIYYIHSGSASAAHSQSIFGKQEGWLVTPKIAIPDDGTKYILRFWSANRFVESYEYNGVWISKGSNDPADGEFLQVWVDTGRSEELTMVDWYEYLLPLGNYAGEEIHIGFKYMGTEAHGWYLDDVSVEPYDVTDAAISAISKPIDGFGLSNAEQVTVTINNNSSESISGFNLKLEVNGTEIATETYTGTIATLSQKDYTFNATLDLSAGGTYDVTVTTMLPNDDIPENDAFTKKVTNSVCGTITTFPWIEDFDNGVISGCWTNYEVDSDWLLWYPEILDDGNGVAASKSVLEYAPGINIPLTPDNYLITPPIQIDNESLVLKYKVGAGSQAKYSEKYAVMVSTTGTNPGDFIQMLHNGKLMGPEFTEREFSLASFMGETIYIAFRHYDCTNQDRLLLDDVEVSDPSASSIIRGGTDMISVYPNPSNGHVNVKVTENSVVRVIDTYGRMVGIYNAEADKTLQFNQASGIYLIQIESNGKVSTHKLIVR